MARKKTQHQELKDKLGDLEQRLEAIGEMLRQRLAEQQERELEQQLQPEPQISLRERALALWLAVKARIHAATVSPAAEAPAAS